MKSFLILLVGFICIGIAVYSYFDISNKTKTYDTTIGFVKEFEVRFSPLPERCAIFSFIVQNQEQTKVSGICATGRSLSALPQIGEKVNIRYDPQNISNAYMDNQSDMYHIPFLWGFWGLLITYIGLVAVTTNYQRNLKKSSSKTDKKSKSFSRYLFGNVYFPSRYGNYQMRLNIIYGVVLFSIIFGLILAMSSESSLELLVAVSLPLITTVILLTGYYLHFLTKK